VKPFRWSEEKNARRVRERGISFDRLASAVRSGAVVDVVPHPNQARYPGQSIFVVLCDGNAYMVPYVEAGDHIFLKTAF
jgi:uncharacterized DUF497 family protein